MPYTSRSLSRDTEAHETAPILDGIYLRMPGL